MQRDARVADGPQPKILIVDDDEIISVALYRHLIGLLYTVDLAVDADSASTLLSEHQYALIVVDAYLTGQLHARALQLIDAVRAHQPRSRILLLTAYGSPALTGHLNSDDHITVLGKPQSISYLAELIEGFVGRA